LWQKLSLCAKLTRKGGWHLWKKRQFNFKFASVLSFLDFGQKSAVGDQAAL
jgi:hypothetical protein